MSIFTANGVAAEPATYLPPVRQLLTLEQVKERLERDLPPGAPLTEKDLDIRFQLTAWPDLLHKIINFAGLTAREQPPPDDTHRKYLANFRDRKARGLSVDGSRYGATLPPLPVQGSLHARRPQLKVVGEGRKS